MIIILIMHKCDSESQTRSGRDQNLTSVRHVRKKECKLLIAPFDLSL